MLGKVRSAVGSAQLLISQKFQQFRGLCDQNLVCIMTQIPGKNCCLESRQENHTKTYSLFIFLPLMTDPVHCVHNMTAHTVRKCINVLCAHNITALPRFMGICKHYNMQVLYKMNEKGASVELQIRF